MSYVVLARKWRPQRFEDLVGQEHVARTLENAISSGRVAHAFLFTGVRGVGKTTSARILAKALNCMGKPGTVPPGTDPGPTISPCLECPACQEIAAGTDMDVREIDGASYNGVDEVRKLQDSLPYRPNRDRYKIVIVDEVHMLTQAAWNAFLKTLEEPPPHVKFIFATTEVHKVPITILSRVQRFDFKMIPARTVAERLRYVLAQESIEADDAAITLLSRQAAGSMRDAMSLLDQVIAFGGSSLVGDDVARVLGVASRSALREIARALLEGSAETCLRIVGELADQGFDIPHVAKDLLALLRDLVVVKVCKNPAELLDLPEDETRDVLALVEKFEEPDLLRLHQAFSKSFDDISRGADPRSSLEMLLVRLALRPPLLPVDELLHRLAHLERRLLDGGAGRGPRPPEGGGRPPQARRVDPPEPNRGARDRAPQSSHSSQRERAPKSDDEPAPGSGAPSAPSGEALSTSEKPSAPPLGAAANDLVGAPSGAASFDGAPTEAPLGASTAAASFGSTPATSSAASASSEPHTAPAFTSEPPDPSIFDAPSDFIPPDEPSGPPPSRAKEERPASPPRSETTNGHTRAGAPTEAPARARASEPRSKPAAQEARHSPPPELDPPLSAEEQSLLARLFQVSERVREEDQQLAAVFEQAVPLQVTEEELVLGLEKGFIFEKQLTASASITLISSALESAWGKRLEVRFVTSSPEAVPHKSLSAARQRERRAKHEAALDEVRNHPRVQDALRILGGELKSVRVPEN